jgi:hypothetical protein
MALSGRGSCRSVLHIAEIVIEILRHLENDLNSLRQAILVSRLWYSTGMDLLWRRPPIYAMTSLRHGLSESHTTLIRELRIKHRTVHLRGKTFPRLKALHCLKMASFVPDIVVLQPAAADAVTDVILQVDETRHMHNTSTVVRVGSTLEALTCLLHDGLLACLGAPEQPLRQLRMLRVHEHHSRNEALAPGMLDFLLGTASSSACPALEVMLFEDIFVGNSAGAGCAFSHFARRPALTELCITNRLYSTVTPVPHAAVVSVWAATSSTGADNDRRSNCHDEDDVVEASCRIQTQPSVEPLKALSISVEPESMALLARMFPALTRLAVAAARARTGAERPLRPDFFAAIGALTALRSLDVRPGYGALLTAADVRALQRLTQLRTLTLRACGSAPDLRPADVLQLLRGLRHAHTLNFLLDWAPPPETLGVLGTACPQLRRLEIWGSIYVAPSLDPMQLQELWEQQQQQGQPPLPLFANLEHLRVRLFDCLGDEQRSLR